MGMILAAIASVHKVALGCFQCTYCQFQQIWVGLSSLECCFTELLRWPEGIFHLVVDVGVILTHNLS